MHNRHSAVFVGDFREAAPYIDYLRGKTLVIGIASSLLFGPTLRQIAADLNLLASLGVRLVVVHGSSSQITAQTEAAGQTPRFHQGRRITDETVLQYAKYACGSLRFDIEAALSIGIPHSPQRGKRLPVACGNFVSARPYGIIDGIDMAYTGRVRKIDTASVQGRLNDGALVLISPLGASLGGQSYNLSMADIAEAAAIALAAEKLIFLIEQPGILNETGQLLSNLSSAEARERLSAGRIPQHQQRLLHAALNAVEQRVQRCQILSGRENGSLISELFTRGGIGTSIAQAPFMRIRTAEHGDIADIIRLIRPLEESGVLLKRSREYLESHIGEFFVLEHDCQIYGCVALKEYPAQQAAELACLVVAPDAQDGGYGELLLDTVVQQCRARGIPTLFALSTHTGDWFGERGFQTASPQDLPPDRLSEYRASGRQSKVFVFHPIP